MGTHVRAWELCQAWSVREQVGLAGYQGTCWGKKSGNVSGGKLMKYILYWPKDFEPEKDMVKCAFSGSIYGSRVRHVLGETEVTWLVGSYGKGSGQR